MTPPRPRTVAMHDELCAAGKCTAEMHRAAIDYRDALESISRSIQQAVDERELATLRWLYEQFDFQGAQRMTREAKAGQ